MCRMVANYALKGQGSLKPLNVSHGCKLRPEGARLFSLHSADVTSVLKPLNVSHGCKLRPEGARLSSLHSADVTSVLKPLNVSHGCKLRPEGARLFSLHSADVTSVLTPLNVSHGCKLRPEGARLSSPWPTPATCLGDCGRSCKLRRWAVSSGLGFKDMWGVVANYAQKGLATCYRWYFISIIPCKILTISISFSVIIL